MGVSLEVQVLRLLAISGNLAKLQGEEEFFSFYTCATNMKKGREASKKEWSRGGRAMRRGAVEEWKEMSVVRVAE